MNEKKELRNFGLTVGGVLVLIGGFLFWYNKPAHIYLFIIGGLLIGLGIILPAVLKPIFRIWMKFSLIIGWIMTRVILSLVFFIAFTSISIFAKLFGKYFIELKWDKSQSTYWNHREEKEFLKENYERQF